MYIESLEIAACVELPVSGEPEKTYIVEASCVEPFELEELPVFWTLYQRHDTGEADAISDHSSRAKAIHAAVEYRKGFDTNPPIIVKDHEHDKTWEV